MQYLVWWASLHSLFNEIQIKLISLCPYNCFVESVYFLTAKISKVTMENIRQIVSCQYCEKMFQNSTFLTKHVELKHPSFTKQSSIVSNLNSEIHNRNNDQHTLLPTKSKIEVQPSEFVDMNKGWCKWNDTTIQKINISAFRK